MRLSVCLSVQQLSSSLSLLSEMVFTDTFTMVSRNVGDRELEQAVRFLHDNGTLLHYEDPLLKDLYFVDPQWLVDMLAHIVTVREINPFVKDGEMSTIMCMFMLCENFSLEYLSTINSSINSNID